MKTRLTAILLITISISAVAVGADPDSTTQAAIERGLTVLERGAGAYPGNQSCFSCHHQTLPMLAMTTARDAGLKFNRELFDGQLKFTRKSFDERKARLSKGEHVGGRAATVSFGLWTLSIAEDSPDDLAAAMTAYLLSIQQPDGRWKPPSNRPPLEVSSVSCTVLSAMGIKRFASQDQQEQVAAAITRAKAWLATVPLEDQEDLNFALWGEVFFGGPETRVEELQNRVLAARNVDGGWSQLPTMNSDAYATGQTLYILAETGLAVSEAPFREAVCYLLETQQDDGSWHVVTRSKPVQPWFDNGDPHEKDQFISIAATGWATSALAKSIVLAQAPSKKPPSQKQSRP